MHGERSTPAARFSASPRSEQALTSTISSARLKPMERRSDKIRIERDRPKKKSGGTSGIVSPNGAAPHRPVVRIVAGQVPRMANEAEQALINAGATIYSRSGVLVRPITD